MGFVTSGRAAITSVGFIAYSPIQAKQALDSYKDALSTALAQLKTKRDKHPELFETDDGSESGRKSLLDALYEEGIIPTYSFPKNVVSTYISKPNGQLKYQVERGLDMAIGEYAPGRAIVVDKTTYQIGGFYYPGGDRTEATAASPARPFIQDANYRKGVMTCEKCGWFGLREDHMEHCPFCGNPTLTPMREMLRPWGFAPKDAKSIETAQLNEEYSATQQPLYSTLPEADDVSEIQGYTNIRMAVRPNQRIIILNKGVGNKGFTVCCDCGAAMPGDDESVLKNVIIAWIGKIAPRFRAREGRRRLRAPCEKRALFARELRPIPGGSARYRAQSAARTRRIRVVPRKLPFVPVCGTGGFFYTHPARNTTDYVNFATKELFA